MHAIIHAVSPYSFRYNNLRVATAFLVNVLHPSACMLPNPPSYKACVIVSIIITLDPATPVIVWYNGLGRSSVDDFPFVSSCFTCDIQHSHGCPREKWTKLNLTDQNAFRTSVLCNFKCVTVVVVFMAIRAYDKFDAVSASMVKSTNR